MIQTEDARDAEPLLEPDSRLFRILRQRVATAARPGTSWLNIANPDEAAFVAVMGGHRLSDRDENLDRFYLISEAACAELKRATNELHALFMHATEHVLKNDEVLERFNIPAVLWPRIRRSWSNRRNQTITGRFDFALTEAGLKVYEYNCDSGSCHMEAGKVQGRWAEHHRCDIGRDPGATARSRGCCTS